MEYHQVAHYVKLGGTVFFFLFLCVVAIYVFWRKDQKTFFGAIWPALAVFFGLTLSYYIAYWLGSAAVLATTVAWIITFVISLRFFKSTDDDRFGDVANLPISDESIIVDQ